MTDDGFIWTFSTVYAALLVIGLLVTVAPLMCWLHLRRLNRTMERVESLLRRQATSTAVKRRATPSDV